MSAFSALILGEKCTQFPWWPQWKDSDVSLYWLFSATEAGGENRLFLCDAADVAEQIPAFVLNKPNPGFSALRGSSYPWGWPCAKVGRCCN